MNQESMQVLTMLAEGKITVEDATRLLEVLGEGAARTEAAPPASRRGERQRRPEDWGAPQTSFGLGQLAAMRAVGVDAAYIRELREAGFPDLQAEQLVSMRAVGVDAAYIRGMREAGFGDLALDKLISMRAVGVNPAWIQELRELGMTDLQPDQLIEMRAVGVDADYIREMHEAGIAVENAVEEA